METSRSASVGNGSVAPFPFIVGCSRSGTTLLRAIFTAHPQMAIPDEAHYVMQMLRKRGKYERPGGFAVGAFLDDLLRHKLFPFWVLPGETVRESFEAEPPDSYANAVRRVFALYAAQLGKPRYGDKSPRNVLNLPLLAETFPDAVFIHVIRDGRNVALSLLEMPWAGPENVVEAAKYWHTRVERGREAGRQLGSRYREIRYETLIENSETTVRSLCDFVGLEFDPAMLRYHEQPDLFQQRRKPSIPGRIREGHHHEPPTKGIRDWRTQMPKRDVALFEVAAGDLLEELGYERGVARTPLWTRIEAHLQMLRGTVRFAFNRLVRRRATLAPEPQEE